MQDTPAVKLTYAATVRSTLPILMSALRLSPPAKEKLEIGPNPQERVYEFEQNVSIPSYLLAIAGGELAFAVRRSFSYHQKDKVLT
jgi:leukotriene-A4 hydrolase